MQRISDLPRKIAQDTMAYMHETNRVEIAPTGCHVALTSVVRGSIGTYRQVNPKKRVAVPLFSPGSKIRATSIRKLPESFVNHGERRLMVHQIAHFAATGETPGDGFDVSHLCHNGACCNPRHLVIEDHSHNMRRQHCLGTIAGTTPCTHDGCTVAHPFEKLVCMHTPACLVRTAFQ
jgi:hypothetical protein